MGAEGSYCDLTAPLFPLPLPLQMCTDGASCKRRVCFFAHTESELRKPEEDPLWLQQQVQAELASGEGGMEVCGGGGRCGQYGSP